MKKLLVSVWIFGWALAVGPPSQACSALALCQPSGAASVLFAYE